MHTQLSVFSLLAVLFSLPASAAARHAHPAQSFSPGRPGWGMTVHVRCGSSAVAACYTLHRCCVRVEGSIFAALHISFYTAPA